MAVSQKRVRQMVVSRGGVIEIVLLPSYSLTPALEASHPGSANAEDRYREVPVTLAGRNGL